MGKEVLVLVEEVVRDILVRMGMISKELVPRVCS
jgi:hypothetical protein